MLSYPFDFKGIRKKLNHKNATAPNVEKEMKKERKIKRIHHSHFLSAYIYEIGKHLRFYRCVLLPISILSQFSKATKISNDMLCIRKYIIRFKFIYAGLLVECVVLSTEYVRQCDELARIFSIFAISKYIYIKKLTNCHTNFSNANITKIPNAKSNRNIRKNLSIRFLWHDA